MRYLFFHLPLYLRNKSIEAPLPLLWVQLGMIEQGLHDGKVVSHLVSQAWQRDNCTVQFKLPEPNVSALVAEPPADVLKKRAARASTNLLDSTALGRAGPGQAEELRRQPPSWRD